MHGIFQHIIFRGTAHAFSVLMHTLVAVRGMSLLSGRLVFRVFRLFTLDTIWRKKKRKHKRELTYTYSRKHTRKHALSNGCDIYKVSKVAHRNR